MRKKIPGVEVKLVGGSGGAFEVSADGTLIFSKHQRGRFPTVAEILENVEKR